MKIYHVIPIPHTHLFDIFYDTGWDLWSRVLVKPSAGVIRLMKGEHIPIKTLYSLFEKELSSEKPIVRTTRD
jgi:hypothetical protein